jgi:hypothetical protein
MSRRKKLRPLQDGQQARPYMVVIACTDRGQHPEARLAVLGQFAGVDGTVRVLWQRAGHPDPLTGWQAPDGSLNFEFTCRRCCRNFRRREPGVLATMDALRATGRARPVLDISLRVALLC